MVAAPAITFVLYSEDSARGALDTLRELLRGMLKCICPGVKMNHVSVGPVLSSGERIPGSYWKETPKERDSQRKRSQLIRAVATQIKQGRIVFFHVDADAVWACRDSACENLKEHWPRFRRDLGTLLGLAAAVPEEKLILAMPFFELESWAFANVTRLRALVREPRDLAALTRWAGDLAELDEVPDIKDVLSVQDAHNLELVQLKNGFPAEALIAVGKSYCATVERLRRSEFVVTGLSEAAARDW